MLHFYRICLAVGSVFNFGGASYTQLFPPFLWRQTPGQARVCHRTYGKGKDNLEDGEEAVSLSSSLFQRSSFFGGSISAYKPGPGHMGGGRGGVTQIDFAQPELAQ